MRPDEFRRHAHDLVDWMADYLEGRHEHRVVPACRPGEVREALPDAAPESAEPFDAIFRDFQDVIVPGMTHWNDPGWFAYFPANHSPPSVLAEMLTATLGAQCMSWQTSPAATELEQVVMEWLRKLTGLPEHFVGVIQDTASTATLVALLTARERITGGGLGRGGVAEHTARLRVYASTQTHSSVDKAVKLAGYGLDNLVRVPTLGDRSMDPEELRRAIERDLEAGFLPTAVCATVGTTSSGAIDPLEPIGLICEEHGIWLHVDAAWAGTAAICPEFRRMLDGIERVDSYVFNPHKWMLTNFDCTAYFVRDVDALLRTFALTPEYLKTAHDADVANFRDWGIQLGRRFRALKLWFVLRSYGAEGLRAMIRDHVQMAADLEAWIDAHPDFELAAPRSLSLVCLRWTPEAGGDLDALNEALLERVNADGSVHLTHTRLSGKYVIRVAIGQWRTEPRHVEDLWALIQQCAVELSPA